MGCEMLRIPHCLDNRLTVNCEILATCSSTYSPVRTSQAVHLSSERAPPNDMTVTFKKKKVPDWARHQDLLTD
jgi:hypothetical protein